MSSEKSWLPDKTHISEQYHQYIPHFEVLLSRLESHFKSLLHVSAMISCKTRIKSFNSFYRKLLKFPPDPSISDMPVLTDLIGMRIICPFLQNLSEVEDLLTKNFTIIEIERKGANRTFYEFGYESIHVLLEIPDIFKVGLSLPPNLIFEVQIRTILQDAWAEVEHELVYKADFSPFDEPLKRKLASINASLSLADIVFQEIRDYQHKLNAEVDTRRDQFYSRADQFTDALLTDDEIVADDIRLDPVKHVVSLQTIDDMILHAIQAHNSSDFETAQSLYTKILSYTVPDTAASIVYKHRGMAFFAQGKYDEAYNDFQESIRLNPANFRSYYYAGIVLMLMERNTEAIEQFSRSLEINSYQAHVHFRRALAYFQEDLIVPALQDLDKAVALGLSKKDEKKLRAAIAKKADII